MSELRLQDPELLDLRTKYAEALKVIKHYACYKFGTAEWDPSLAQEFLYKHKPETNNKE